jgi:twitching motility protein PilT
MARLDPFIDRLFAESASELVLEAGTGAVLATPRGAVPLIRQPLTGAQILGALGEIVPASARAALARPGATAFPYVAPAGAVEVRVEVKDGGARAVVTRKVNGHGNGTPALTPVPASVPVAAAAATPPVTAASTTGDAPIPAPADPRAAFDALLDAMVARRASDLHLASSAPPNLRIDGDMVPIASYGPLSHERLKALLWTMRPRPPASV